MANPTTFVDLHQEFRRRGYHMDSTNTHPIRASKPRNGNESKQQFLERIAKNPEVAITQAQYGYIMQHHGSSGEEAFKAACHLSGMEGVPDPVNERIAAVVEQRLAPIMESMQRLERLIVEKLYKLPDPPEETEAEAKPKQPKQPKA